MKIKILTTIAATLLLLSSCTEEARNQITRQADNLLGKNFKVSYIDEGTVVRSWTVNDGKITSGKDKNSQLLGYYYFWTEETGYVQTPIDRTIIEEIKKKKR